MPKYGLLCICYYIKLTFATFSQPSVLPLLNFPYDDNEFITIYNTILKKEAISCKHQPQVREGTIFTDDQTLSKLNLLGPYQASTIGLDTPRT